MNLNLLAKNTALIERARAFAREKHRNHLRKYTGVPYYTHLENVADLVAMVSNDEEMIAAALLHDTLEDTDTTYDELVENFGRRVADLVKELTNVSKKTDGNRATRKAMDRDRLANISADGQTIKLADLADNTKTIVLYDPDFAVLYLREKAELLEVMKLGDPILWEMASMHTDGT
jgi:(p)ppGpp synthase/HD superfamily hydrolase